MGEQYHAFICQIPQNKIIRDVSNRNIANCPYDWNCKPTLLVYGRVAI